MLKASARAADAKKSANWDSESAETHAPDFGLAKPNSDAAGSRRHSGTSERAVCAARYLTSESSLNIGRYMLMMITPTIAPTPIIIRGSMIAVSEAIAASTSSS